MPNHCMWYPYVYRYCDENQPSVSAIYTAPHVVLADQLSCAAQLSRCQLKANDTYVGRQALTIPRKELSCRERDLNSQSLAYQVGALSTELL